MFNPGEILRERYEIKQLLGQGGMGAVYEAHDRVFETSVALKEIVVDFSRAHNTNAQELIHHAFEREAKLLAKINHETFPHVKDYFSDDDRQFLVMELVDGEDLSKLLRMRGAPFSSDDLENWANQLLDGLDYLHTQDPPIIHRDLKPQNLKLNSRGKIKLLDFGIAKGSDSANSNTITDQTIFAATLNYSPIEQMLRVIDPTFLAVITHKYDKQVSALLDQNADPRSDIYALGATLYNLATATTPVEAVKRGVEVWEGKPDPLRPANEINPTISPALSDWLSRSMQINREDRFSSSAEMLESLNSFTVARTNALPQNSRIENPSSDELRKTQSCAVTAIQAPIPPPHNSNPVPANQVSSGGKKGGFNLLWLIPIFGVMLLLFAGAVGAGAWLLIGRSKVPVQNSKIEGNSSVETNSESSSVSSTTNVEGNSDSKDSSSATNGAASSKDHPTPGSTKSARSESNTYGVAQKPAAISIPKHLATPQPPAVRSIPKPSAKPKTPNRQQTKKDMNCIFTDDC